MASENTNVSGELLNLLDSTPSSSGPREIHSAPHQTWNFGTDDTSQILRLIEANAVCGVIAPTGSGKSTTLMEAIYQTEARIFVVELTIPAVENLYRYMAGRLGAENVGWAAEGSVNYNEKSRLVYCTAGHMRRKMLNLFNQGAVVSNQVDFCDVLVIDEAHAGGLDADVVMELWKTAIQSGALVPRLVLASATLNMTTSQFPRAPYYRIEATGFPVEIQWHSRDYSPETKDLYSDVAQVIYAKHRETPLGPGDPPSVWLVFCAGSNEVETVCEALTQLKAERLSALPIYSNLPSEQTTQIFQKPPPGERRIIVATNIAEASITVDGLSGIFDTLTEKYGETSISGGFRLVLSNISKSSAQQRAGRTGRTGPGFCYRMSTSKFFETLPEHRPLEITRVPLHSMIIELLSVGLAPEKMFLSRLPSSRLRSSIRVLKNLGMIDSNDRVTPMGYFAPQYPLSVRSAAILWLWIASGQPLFPCIAAVSLIDCYGPSYFWYPRKTPDLKDSDYDAVVESHYQKYFSQYDSNYDLEVLLKMWNHMLGDLQSLNPKRQILTRWTTGHSLNNKKIVECLNIARQICNTLIRQKHQFQYGPFTPEGCLSVLSPILRRVYEDQLYVRSGGVRGPYINTMTNEYYRLDSKAHLRSSTVDPPSQIIGLITAEIQSKKGGLPSKLISLCHPSEVKFTPPVQPSSAHRQKIHPPWGESRPNRPSQIHRAPLRSTGSDHIPQDLAPAPPTGGAHGSHPARLSPMADLHSRESLRDEPPVKPQKWVAVNSASSSNPQMTVPEASQNHHAQPRGPLPRTTSRSTDVGIESTDPAVISPTEITPGLKLIVRSLAFQLPGFKLLAKALPEKKDPIQTTPSSPPRVSPPKVSSPPRVSPPKVSSPPRVSPPTVSSLPRVSPPTISLSRVGSGVIGANTPPPVGGMAASPPRIQLPSSSRR